jgi:5-methylcytosine-specific restriction protein B
MAKAKSNRLTVYFPLLLDALRSTDPLPMRPAEAIAWIRTRVDVAADDLVRVVENGSQTIFENDIHWARFYLVKAGLIDRAKRGLWALTAQGRETRLTEEETWALYVRIRDASRPGASQDEAELPAPDTVEEDADGGRAYWFVGASWDGDDQTARFIESGIWENGYEDRFTDVVRSIRAGDRIVIKATFVQKHHLPFDIGGKPASVMRIKATGIILENFNDGRKVKVAWDPPAEPRDWYFYTYLTTIVKADIDSDQGRRLIDFTFRGGVQDYTWWLAQPYWVRKYDANSQPAISIPAPEAHVDDDIVEIDEAPAYTLDDIVADGCFLSRAKLGDIFDSWQSKKNLILQGPPGTGKTWLAKRLGFALVGSNDRETSRNRLRVVQFHPSLTYEDFVRGWRPAGDGRLAMTDGILMQAIEAAKSEPDRPFVLVIEEINRGNPAQIFGEMLTLLENTKRRASEAIELAYRKSSDERVYIPENLYVIGTMNVADRSLAIVDLALRRRFAFIDLEPQLGPSWRDWSVRRGLDAAFCSEIELRIEALNADIAAAVSLGPQYRIGHSYVTPDADEDVTDGFGWFRAKINNEIGPLLDEYWYDSPDAAKSARTKLLAGLR